MKRSMKTLCFLAVFFTAFNTFASEVISTPIALYRCFPTSSQPRPSHAPTKSSSPINIYYEESSQSLTFCTKNESEVTYHIYSELDELEIQGCCIFDEEGKYSVSLEGLSTGTHTLYVSINNTQYQGIFETEG